MRAVVCLLAVLSLAAASSPVAQEKHLIDPMLPGSLDPKPLPPLKNPDAPSIPAKELFARKSTPFPGPPRSIGGDFNGCLAGAVSLPITDPTWQVMRPSRNRNWGNPQLIRFIERFATNAKKVGWNGLLVGDMSQPRGGFRAHQPSNRPRRRYLVCADARPRAKPRGARVRPGHRCGRARSARC